jgi:hypothetical protein
MKAMLPVLAALMFAVASSQAIAQSQDGQQACEGDVYDLCGDKIPDQDEIVACLRKKWSKVSKECRQVMASYGKNQKKREPKGGAPKANGSRY